MKYVLCSRKAILDLCIYHRGAKRGSNLSTVY